VGLPIAKVPPMLNNIFFHRLMNYYSAQWTATFGVPGFFKPRFLDPWFGIKSSVDQLSYYDTDQLQETLMRLIDFERINAQHVRLSMGAVNVETGDLIYFDNTKIKIGPEHVMASAAFPPAMPAVMVDGQYFWDGGIHSNTLINLLLTENIPRSLCIMSNLFDSYGMRPRVMDDVCRRVKDISYSSRHKQFVKLYAALHQLRHELHVLAKYVPKDVKQKAEIKDILDRSHDSTLHIVRLHYKGRDSDLSSKDYEFSIPSIINHRAAGLIDMNKALDKAPWISAKANDRGLVMHEISNQITDDTLPFYDPF
jgi:NTE family protein